MKKSLIALAALAATSAFAQSSVTIYGGVGAVVAHVPAIGAFTAIGAAARTAAQPSQTRIDNLGVADSAVTFAAVEDLGGGLKASAIMNMRFGADDGAQGPAQGSRLFQNVKLALSGGFGELAIGRFNAPVDVMRGFGDHWLGYDHGATVFGHASDAPTRYNNTLQYTTPVMSGFKVSAAYALKEETLPTTKNLAEVALSYAGGPLKAGLGLTRNAGLVKDKNVTTLGAQYDFGVARPAVVHSRTDNAGLVSNRTDLQVTVPVTPSINLRAGYERQKTNGFGRVTGMGFGGEYFLSKRTRLLADVLKRNSESTAVGDWDGVAVFVGLKHTF
jgi:predicted porin